MPPHVALEQDTVYALTAAPDFERSGICFAARRSGLYQSRDGGATWQYLFESLALPSGLPVTAVAFAADYPADQSIFAGVPGGLLRSTDGGTTWMLVELTDPAPVISCILLPPDDTGGVTFWLGSTTSGIFHVSRGGDEWRRWNYGLLDWHVLCMAAHWRPEQSQLYAGTETGLFVSDNLGWSWNALAIPSDAAPVSALATTAQALYAGSEQGEVYRSGDQGLTWNSLRPIGGGSVNALLVESHPAGRDTVLTLNVDGIHLAADKAEQWQHILAVEPSEAIPTSITAPLGLHPGAPLLVGFEEGEVRRLALPA